MKLAFVAFASPLTVAMLLLASLTAPIVATAQNKVPPCGDNLTKSAADVVAAYKKNPQVLVVLVKKGVEIKVAPTFGELGDYKIPTVCETTEGFFAVSLGSKNLPMIAYQSGARFSKVSHLVSVGTFRGWVANDDVTEYGVLSREELKTIESYALL